MRDDQAFLGAAAQDTDTLLLEHRFSRFQVVDVQRHQMLARTDIADAPQAFHLVGRLRAAIQREHAVAGPERRVRFIVRRVEILPQHRRRPHLLHEIERRLRIGRPITNKRPPVIDAHHVDQRLARHRRHLGAEARFPFAPAVHLRPLEVDAGGVLGMGEDETAFHAAHPLHADVVEPLGGFLEVRHVHGETEHAGAVARQHLGRAAAGHRRLHQLDAVVGDPGHAALARDERIGAVGEFDGAQADQPAELLHRGVVIVDECGTMEGPEDGRWCGHDGFSSLAVE